MFCLRFLSILIVRFLEGSGNDVPEGSYGVQLEGKGKALVSTYVPFRNCKTHFDVIVEI